VAEPDPDRSSAARRAAELALVRVCHHYGELPGFVLIGGLVPVLLCSDASLRHAGTSDVDVQVNLEIAGGSVNAARLERALRNADFSPDAERVWRWRSSPSDGPVAVIKFELLADLVDLPQGTTVVFDGSKQLGAANLRGTGFAAEDIQIHTLVVNDHGTRLTADVNVTGLSGFLLAKTAAAHGRHKPKDYYDIAFVLLHHNVEANAPAAGVLARFGLPALIRTPLLDLQANFVDDLSFGTQSYVHQVTQDHPDLDPDEMATDAVLAVGDFTSILLASRDGAARL
jgi:hypothetical protein